MLLINRWAFFSKKGINLNLEKDYFVKIDVQDAAGRDAVLEAVTDRNGNIIFIEIVNKGTGYSNPVITVRDLKLNKEYVIPAGNITLDGDGGIVSVSTASLPGGWTYPAFLWFGDVYFPEKVPAKLIENEHVFILEKVFKNGKIHYTTPGNAGTEPGFIKCKWEKGECEADEKAFFLFKVANDKELPVIEKIEEENFSLSPGGNLVSVNGKLYRQFFDKKPRALQLNIGFSFETEGIFERILKIYDTGGNSEILIAEILFRGEVEAEDERFNTLLTNLGLQVNAEEEFIFRDSDIEEALPNVRLLNEKRKEFLLTYSEIIPYIGSYKAIFNVLKWLGYDDLRLKEYFLNVDENSPNFKKFKPVEPGKEQSRLVPFGKYKKTNLFGLYYDINKETGKFDESGMPIVEDAYAFTIEEVLIKLFALKKYLKEKFLPLNARIIDIVGEGIYFERYRTNTWADGTRIFEINLTREAKFEVEPENPVIIDLRKIQNFDYFKPARLKAVIDKKSPEKKLYSIVIEEPGYGYLGNYDLDPSGKYIELIFEGGAPSEHAKAVAEIELSTGAIKSVNIISYGKNYSTAPEVYVPSPDYPHPSVPVNKIKDINVNFFKRFEKNNFADKPGIPVGAPVTLRADSFDITWDELQIPWDSLYFDFRPAEVRAVVNGGEITGFDILFPGQGYQNPPAVTLEGGNPEIPAQVSALMTNGQITGFDILFPGQGYKAVPVVRLTGGNVSSSLNTWDTVGIGNFYEMEWKITGPKNYKFRKRGRIDELKEYEVILPYIGQYNVEMVLYTTDNNFTNLIKKNCITVSLPDVRIAGIARHIRPWNSWDDLDISWEKAHFSWLKPAVHETTWDDMQVSWDDLDLKTYAAYENKFPAVKEMPVKAISETDRYFGNITQIDFKNKKIKAISVPVRPGLSAGDYVFLRSGKNVFRTQIENIEYFYKINDIKIIDGGNYEITYDPSAAPPYVFVHGTWNVSPVENILLKIDPPGNNGTPAIASAKINGKIKSLTVLDIGSGYVKIKDLEKIEFDFDIKRGIVTGIEVSGISGNFNDGFYSNIEVQYGSGNGLRVNVNIKNGTVDFIAVSEGGENYAVNDTVILSNSFIGTGNINLKITSVIDSKFTEKDYLDFGFDIITLQGLTDENSEIAAAEAFYNNLLNSGSNLIHSVNYTPGTDKVTVILRGKNYLITKNLAYANSDVKINKFDVAAEPYGVAIDPANAAPGTYEIFNIIFQDPVFENGTTAGGPALFQNGSFYGWYDPYNNARVPLPLALPQPWASGGTGSGYVSPPQKFFVIDKNLHIVEGISEIKFAVTIEGPVAKIQILNAGSGYTALPGIYIEPVSQQPAQLKACFAEKFAEFAEITVKKLPAGVHPGWDLLKSTGQSIQIESERAQNLVPGMWVTLRNEREIPVKKSKILGKYYDDLNILKGIVVEDNNLDFLKPGEKCRIYKIRKINYGTGNNFTVSAPENKIIIHDGTLPLDKEIVKGFHTVILQNYDAATGVFDYKQRIKILNIEKQGTEWHLFVEPLDGDLAMFNNETNSYLEYKYYEFPAVVHDVQGNTVFLNFDDWNEHENFEKEEDWYIDFGSVSGEYSVQVKEIGFYDNIALVTVDDINSELWNVSTPFLVRYREFDEDYAKKRLGLNILTWENADENKWDDLRNFSWEMMEFVPHQYCSFEIAKVRPGARIQWNDEPPFEFKEIDPKSTQAEQLQQAADELNRTSKNSLSLFDYYVLDNKIVAVAKSPGAFALGKIKFENGAEGTYTDVTVSHSFPLNNAFNKDWEDGKFGIFNKKAYWHALKRTYEEWGTDPAGNAGWYPGNRMPKKYESLTQKHVSEKIPYAGVIGGAFEWDDTKIFNKFSELPIFTTCIFKEISEIAGKSKFRWRLFDKDGILLTEVENAHLIWTFTRKGTYTIELNVTDSNGNSAIKTFQGFVKIID